MSTETVLKAIRCLAFSRATSIGGSPASIGRVPFGAVFYTSRIARRAAFQGFDRVSMFPCWPVLTVCGLFTSRLVGVFVLPGHHASAAYSRVRSTTVKTALRIC